MLKVAAEKGLQLVDAHGAYCDCEMTASALGSRPEWDAAVGHWTWGGNLAHAGGTLRYQAQGEF